MSRFEQECAQFNQWIERKYTHKGLIMKLMRNLMTRVNRNGFTVSGCNHLSILGTDNKEIILEVVNFINNDIIKFQGIEITFVERIKRNGYGRIVTSWTFMLSEVEETTTDETTVEETTTEETTVEEIAPKCV